MVISRSRARALALLCLLSLCLAVTACGNKGPLKLPAAADKVASE